MCGHCVDIARKEFERWTDEQKRTARLAVLRPESSSDLSPRGDASRYARGREVQRAIDDERYQKVVAPKVHAIRAAVAQAEEQMTEGRNPGDVLRILLTNVRTDSSEIPLALPV